MWPITAIFSPTISYNLLALLGPALSAWSAFFLCLHLSQSSCAGWIGVFVFGFSTYQIGQTLGGHLNLTWLCALPALLLTAILFCQNQRNWRWTAGLLTLWLSIQFGILREIFVSTALMGALAWLGAYWLYPAYRRVLVQLVGLLFLAAVITALIYAPYWFAFLQHLHDAQTESVLSEVGQPLNLILPTPLTALIPQAWAEVSHYVLWGSEIEISLYFGLPLLALWLIFCIKGWRRSPQQRYLFWAFLLSIIFSCGPVLYLGHMPLLPLPDALWMHISLLNKLIPVRFDLYAWLSMAITSSMWLKRCDIADHWKWPLLLFGLILILPSFSHTQRPCQSKIVQPAFITQGLYRYWFKPNQPALFIVNQPHHASMMRWQVDTHMYFKLYTGYVNFYPPNNYPFYALAAQTMSRNYSAKSAQQLSELVSHFHIPAVFTNHATQQQWHNLFSQLPQPAHRVGDLEVYATHVH